MDLFFRRGLKMAL